MPVIAIFRVVVLAAPLLSLKTMLYPLSKMGNPMVAVPVEFTKITLVPDDAVYDKPVIVVKDTTSFLIYVFWKGLLKEPMMNVPEPCVVMFPDVWMPNVASLLTFNMFIFWLYMKTPVVLMIKLVFPPAMNGVPLSTLKMLADAPVKATLVEFMV